MFFPIKLLSFPKTLLIPTNKPFMIQILIIIVILLSHQGNFVIQSNLYSNIPPILINEYILCFS